MRTIHISETIDYHEACPYCGESALYLEFDESEEDGTPTDTGTHVHCRFEQEEDPRDHCAMPYVYWLPIQQGARLAGALKWYRRRGMQKHERWRGNALVALGGREAGAVEPCMIEGRTYYRARVNTAGYSRIPLGTFATRRIAQAHVRAALEARNATA